MKTALDTNILSALLGGEHNVHAVGDSLREYQRDGPLIISPVVYGELFAYPKITETYLVRLLERTGIRIEYRIDESTWTEAGRRYALYADRRRVSMKMAPRRLLADFVIGAHAVEHAHRLITFDTTFFAGYFPELPLLTPSIA